MFYNNNKQKRRGEENEPKKRLKKLKETKGGKVRMLKMCKNGSGITNSFGCNNSSTFDISRSKYKLSIGQKWNHPKKVKMQEENMDKQKQMNRKIYLIYQI